MEKERLGIRDKDIMEMKRLIIGIAIIALCAWGIYDQAQKGAKYSAARIAAEKGRGR